MNYADEAIQLWSEHEALEKRISTRSLFNRGRAEKKWAMQTARNQAQYDQEWWILRELKILNDADLVRASMIEKSQYLREKSRSLSLLALVSGMQATQIPADRKF